MVNYALIGFGYWGPNIARSAMKLKGINLIAVCDLDPKQLEQAKLLYRDAEMVTDVDQIFKDPEIEAVLIATPAKTHFELAKKALENGKHVLIEKPLTINIDEANELKKLNEKYKKIVMVGHTFEYNPGIRRIKEFIDQDEMGKLYYIYSTRVNLGQIRGDINALWNLAPHDISIANYLLGSSPIEVMANGACFLQPNIEDVVFAYLKYPHNILVEVHVSWLDPAKKRELTIVGAKKMLVFDDLDNEMPIKIYDKRVDTGDVAKSLSSEYKIKLHSGDIYVPQIESKEPLIEELKHFFECIEGNTQPLTGIDNGLEVVKVLEACQMSLRSNKWIKIG